MKPTMSFILNLNDNTLDLSDKEDRKLFENNSKGLETALRFNGRKETFNNFLKLVSHQIKKVRLVEVLEIATKWDTRTVTPRPPQTIVNIFNKKEVTKDDLKTHMDLVWAGTGFGGGAGE
eukprot:3292609-Ditylum_brightwellii.AAC.1